MGIFYNCIHWRVCALPCPLDIKECKHYKEDTEKHGHWVEHNYKQTQDREDYEHPYECSVCHFRQGILRTNYCWECGAKMDESEDLK